MASGYTSNYGLCQWQPGDKFLREEFNQDNEKIDAALKAAEDRATAETGQVRTRLEAINYNLCNLLLQNDYEGKYTGYKKALLFDGFQDIEGIANMNGFLQSDGTLWLERVGQSDIALGTGGGTIQSGRIKTLTMTGCGTITGFSCWLYSYYELTEQVTGDYAVIINEKEVASGSFSLAPPQQQKDTERTISFSGVYIRAGDRCTVELSLDSSSTSLRISADSNGVGGTLRVRPGGASSGSITAKAAALPENRGVVAWVRHNGGQVSLSLKNGADTISLTEENRRTSIDPQTGEACTEQAFRLDQTLSATEWQVVLAGSLNEEESEMEIYDYGVIVI